MFCLKSKETGSSCYKLGGECTGCNQLCSRIKENVKDTFTQVKPVFKEPNYGGVSSSGALTPSGFDAGDTTHYKDVGINSKSVKPHNGWVTDRDPRPTSSHVVLLTDEEVKIMESQLPKGKTVCKCCSKVIDKFPNGKRRGRPLSYCSDTCKAKAKNLQSKLSQDRVNPYKVALDQYLDTKDKLKKENINFTGYSDPKGQLVFSKNIYDCITPEDFMTGEYNYKLGHIYEYIKCRPIDGFNSIKKVLEDVFKIYNTVVKPKAGTKRKLYHGAMCRAGFDDGSRRKAGFKDAVSDDSVSKRDVAKTLKSQKVDWSEYDKYYVEYRDENYELAIKYDGFVLDPDNSTCDDDVVDVPAGALDKHYDKCIGEDYGRYNNLRDGYSPSG